MLLFVILLTCQWGDFSRSVSGRTLRLYSLAAVLIGINWFIYVWAVNQGYIIETSLGYFINPLLSVLLGVFFLRERLRPWQWLPVGLAALGVVYLTVLYGRPPWIALLLAVSFGIYGLVKKTAPLGSLYGLTLETAILFVPAVLYLVIMEISGAAAFLHVDAWSDFLMIGAGLVTTVPLLMFASAARRIPLSMVGIMQYIAPTLQFMLGVLVFHEPFEASQAVGFGIVWVGLVIFWVEGFLAQRAAPVESLPGPGEG
jgi:chloramphenicol-sensitive protein RarD